MKGKTWLQLILKVDPRLIEAANDFLVGVLDAGVEAAAVDEPGYGVINAYIRRSDPRQDEVAQVVDQVSSYLADLEKIFAAAPSKVRAILIEEQDWSREWKRFFHPFAIVPGLVIAPSWEGYKGRENELVITMDPGMAFGTGHHATTSLCVEFLREILRETQGKKMLDVGTGTGILGMSALLFGAAEVVATEIDPEAARVARENILQNAMAAKMSVTTRPLAEIPGPFDLVVANIVHDVLLDLATDLSALLAPGGFLLLSGLLGEKQMQSVQKRFSVQGLDAFGQKMRDNWGALCLQLSL
ncbi:MAG: 50S ribosomal protein L11 methyltransferase [Deltaproteobacteria bacterium]|nr:MAG: 50S ribosomal protein L11 methyltransferase [Deltaproteobacteria bacterium]